MTRKIIASILCFLIFCGIFAGCSQTSKAAETTTATEFTAEFDTVPPTTAETEPAFDGTVRLRNISFTADETMIVTRGTEDSVGVEIIPGKAYVELLSQDISKLDQSQVDLFLEEFRKILIGDSEILGQSPFAVELAGFEASGISGGEIRENEEIWGCIVIAFSDGQFAYGFKITVHPDDLEGYGYDAGVFLGTATYTGPECKMPGNGEEPLTTPGETTVSETKSAETEIVSHEPKLDSPETDPLEDEPAEEMVWIPTGGGKKYHSRSSCSNMDDPQYVPLSTAKAKGFTPCKRCH